MLLSTAGNNNFNDINYVNFAAHTYLLLNQNTNPGSVEAKCRISLKICCRKYRTAVWYFFQAISRCRKRVSLLFTAHAKIHLISHLEGELKPNGSLTAIYIFGIVAFLLC